MTKRGVFGGSLVGSSSIGWNLSRLVRKRYAGKGVFDGVGEPFDLMELARAGKCEAEVSTDDHASFMTHWTRADGAHLDPANAIYDVRWDGHALKVVVARWKQAFETHVQSIVVADSEEIARRFTEAACAFCNHPEQAILKFTAGCWSKSHDLWTAIQASSFDDLVLAGDLKERIIEDFTSFLGARAEYDRYRVPHKRGALLLGPPGNGKTHCLRALIKLLAVPCLYVTSLKSRYGEEDSHIDAVFERARQITPCVLVFEDLDSMIHPLNRSFFLNQLDGLSNASGMITLATTNHPEALDPAIIDRPSRFDRKYHFLLPELAERARYLTQWNERLERDMRIGKRDLTRFAKLTEGFSFAYLKELYLASMMHWMVDRRPKAMPDVLFEKIELLRAQMATPERITASQLPVVTGL